MYATLARCGNRRRQGRHQGKLGEDIEGVGLF
jgi:hypothetical protein